MNAAKSRRLLRNAIGALLVTLGGCGVTNNVARLRDVSPHERYARRVT